MELFFKRLFWIFNLTLLLILCVGFFPVMGMALIRDSIAGTVPLNLILPFIGLVGAPIATTIAGINRQKAKSPLSLFIPIARSDSCY
jgi:hypothetical protein